MAKTCPRCSTEKSSTDFHRRSGARDGESSDVCKTCDHARRKLNKTRVLEAKAGRRVPPCCEVCGRADAKKRLQWDHDHATGIFRGWLCHSCNLALGRMLDSPALLRRLADYLERSGPGPLPFSEWAEPTLSLSQKMVAAGYTGRARPQLGDNE